MRASSTARRGRPCGFGAGAPNGERMGEAAAKGAGMVCGGLVVVVPEAIVQRCPCAAGSNDDRHHE
jgi:hypothetical protein